MTRLTTADIADIAVDLKKYDARLITGTGCSLRGIACRAGEVDEGKLETILPDIRVGVIPISSGQGILEGFCDSVMNILLHMGCNAFVTRTTDAAGVAESFEKKSDIIMLADEDRFVALDLRSRGIADNSVCTGKAFAVGLDLMAGGLNGQKVLVIGCGPVGRSAAEALLKMGAKVSVFDIRNARSSSLAETIGQPFDSKIQIAKALEPALAQHKLIIDASPAADIIQARHIRPDTYISAPGVPCGLSIEAEAKILNRLLHDRLQLGVATMLVCTVKGL